MPRLTVPTVNITMLLNYNEIMTINELNKYLQSLNRDIIEDAANIVAETATSYFKETFKYKGFDGNPWLQAKHPKRTGSLLIDSGALVNSIRPAIVTKEKVVISAGNSHTPYAQIHNEGYKGVIQIGAHTRLRKGKQEKVKSHSRKVDIPQRQFMGQSEILNDKIHGDITNYLNSKLKKL